MVFSLTMVLGNIPPISDASILRLLGVIPDNEFVSEAEIDHFVSF